MTDKFIVGKSGVRAVMSIGGTVIEEIAPGAPDDPFAWWNDPNEVENRAEAAANQVRRAAEQLGGRRFHTPPVYPAFI